MTLHEGAGSINRDFRLWRILFPAYWVGLFVATHIPKVPEPIAPVLEFDKLVHAAAYLILAALGWRAWPATQARRTWRRAATWAAVFLAYAVADELLQELTGRHCELADWAADAVGVFLGLGVMLAWQRRRPPSVSA